MRERRSQLEEKKEKIRKVRFLLVTNEPKEEGQKKLNEVLSEHPFLLELRTLFLEIGQALRPNSYEEGLEKIKEIEIRKTYSPDLKKALKLLKDNAEKVLSYKKVEDIGPETRLRVNCEWEMRKGRKIVKLRYGLKSVVKKAFLLSQKYKTPIKIALDKKIKR